MAHKNRVQRDTKTLEEDYRKLAPILPAFCGEMERQLSQLLNNADVPLGFPLQYRVKTWESITEKFDRVSMSIDRIKDLQDLVGFRVILLFRKDVNVIADLIENNFQISKRINTADRLGEDRFGYSSHHFVVSIPTTWLAVPTLSAYKDLLVEIQVRTVAQHIWAEVSHKLQYKNESSVPLSLRRSIFRASALLEIVDLEFGRILEERSIYRETENPKNIDERLNVDLLEKIADAYLPHKNKFSSESLEEVLADLEAFRILTRGELQPIIEKHRDSAVRDDHHIVECLLKGKSLIDLPGDKIAKNFYGDPQRLAAGVFYTHAGLLRRIMNLEFGKRWSDYADQKPKIEI